uniref:Uncharacterized protein n=1 Tax=Cacopsylla melanoneura TaxID=428564 RepID=A0A8D8YUD0_9HEMI
MSFSLVFSESHLARKLTVVADAVHLPTSYLMLFLIFIFFIRNFRNFILIWRAYLFFDTFLKKVTISRNIIALEFYFLFLFSHTSTKLVLNTYFPLQLKINFNELEKSDR